MKKIAVIFGSANSKGHTAQLVEHIQMLASASDLAFDMKVFDLAQFEITPFDYAHRNRDDDFIPLIKQLVEFDGWIFASPVYWYSMSAQLKVFVDRLSDLLTIEKPLGRQLRGKSTAVLATSASLELPNCFIEAFTLTFDYLGMDFITQLHCECSDGFDSSKHIKQLSRFVQQL